MKRSVAQLATIGFGVFALLAGPPLFAAVKDQVATRVAAYRELGAAFKNVNDGLRANTPQMTVLRISARQIRDISRQQYSLFPVGSGRGSGAKTAAKPEIWSNAAGFRAAQDVFARQANALVAATERNDVRGMRAAARTLGRSCANCHRTYRVDTRN